MDEVQQPLSSIKLDFLDQAQIGTDPADAPPPLCDETSQFHRCLSRYGNLILTMIEIKVPLLDVCLDFYLTDFQIKIKCPIC